MSILVAILITALLSLITLWVYEKYWDKSLDVSISFDEDHVKEGETGTITEIVCNRKRLPLLSLIIKFPIDRSIQYKKKENTKESDKQYRSDSISAMPYEKVTRRFEVKFTKRGLYTISDFDLVAAEFFYRTFFAKRIKNSSSIYVYPVHTKVSSIYPSMERMMGEYISQTFVYEDPFEFKGIRAYEPTDSMKKINWGMSAKTGELMVNQFYDTNRSSVTLFLEMEQMGMQYYEGLAEEAIRVIRTYLEMCLKQGIPVRVVTNAADILTGSQIEIKEGAGKGHMDYCLKKLARINTKTNAGDFTKLLDNQTAKNSGLSILISISQSDRLKEAYERYLGRNGYGEWIIMADAYTERKAVSNRIKIEYGVVD